MRGFPRIPELVRTVLASRCATASGWLRLSLQICVGSPPPRPGNAARHLRLSASVRMHRARIACLFTERGSPMPIALSYDGDDIGGLPSSACRSIFRRNTPHVPCAVASPCQTCGHASLYLYHCMLCRVSFVISCTIVFHVSCIGAPPSTHWGDHAAGTLASRRQRPHQHFSMQARTANNWPCWRHPAGDFLRPRGLPRLQRAQSSASDTRARAFRPGLTMH